MMAKKRLSYEDALAKIDIISQQLESGEAALEKSIELYKEGIELILFCKNALNLAEKEVMELKTNFEGKFSLEPFDNFVEEKDYES